jgi:hypothetical protein
MRSKDVSYLILKIRRRLQIRRWRERSNLVHRVVILSREMVRKFD